MTFAVGSKTVGARVIGNHRHIVITQIIVRFVIREWDSGTGVPLVLFGHLVVLIVVVHVRVGDLCAEPLFVLSFVLSIRPMTNRTTVCDSRAVTP